MAYAQNQTTCSDSGIFLKKIYIYTSKVAAIGKT